MRREVNQARSEQSRRLAEAIGDDYAKVAFSPVGRAANLYTVEEKNKVNKNFSGM